MIDLLTEEQMHQMLKNSCRFRGDVKIRALDTGLSSSNISLALSGKIPISEKIADYFGYEKVTMYRKKKYVL